MITILEGPDCSGKTTLAKMGYSDCQYVHLGPPPKKTWQPRDEYDARAFPAWTQYMQEVYGATDGNLELLDYLFDRLMYGELVYGPVMRPKETQLNWVHVRMLERVLLASQSIVVACQTDYQTCLDMWKEQKALRDEYVDDTTRFKQIWDGYKALWSNVSLPIVEYDFTKDDIEAIVKLADTQRSPKNYGPGIGNYVDGVTLLVGEQVNPKAAVNNWPFIALAGSSYWLTEQLIEAGVRESQLYWVNALDSTGKVTSADFLKEKEELEQTHLVPGKIVALGKAAMIWCQKAKLDRDIVEVPHPAFWKRFHYGKTYRLIEELL